MLSCKGDGMTANGFALLDGEAPVLVWLLLGVVLLLLAAASAVRIVDSEHRAVVIRLGRASRVRGPGLVVSLPWLERVQAVSISPTSTGAVTVRGRTKEGVRVSMGVEAVYQIVDPMVVAETRPHTATRLIDDLERITHHEVSEANLSQLLEDRELLTTRIKTALSARSFSLGIQVSDVELTTVEAELHREVLRWMQ
jgi:regulator of protease activity HflC (stomatin/prohibitin superfamily)